MCCDDDDEDDDDEEDVDDDDEAKPPCSATSLLRTRSVLLATRIMALSRASSFRILRNKHVSRKDRQELLNEQTTIC